MPTLAKGFFRKRRASLNGVIKPIIILLAIAVISVGLYSGYQAIGNYLDGKIAVERSKYEEATEELDEYKKDTKKRLEALSKDVEILQSEKMALVQKVDNKTEEIRTIRHTITDLEDVGRTLTDVNDKLYNANLQIQEYKKVVNQYESRFIVMKKTVLTQEEIIKQCVIVAKEFEQLYLREEQLRKIAESSLKASNTRLLWEKTKFKGSSVLLLAAGGFVLYNELSK